MLAQVPTSSWKTIPQPETTYPKILAPETAHAEASQPETTQLYFPASVFHRYR